MGRLHATDDFPSQEPVSARNYHTLGGRVDYRRARLRLGTQYRQVYNVNSPAAFAMHSSHSRNYSANASWPARDWFSLDASYARLHLVQRHA